VGLIHSGISFAEGRAEQLWTPLRPLLFRPDVLDHSAWRGGAGARFMDAAGDLCFAWEYQVVHTYAINTDKVAPGTITTARDLLDPRWKGQILSSDPRVGIGLLAATSVAKAWGVETLGRLLVDQRPKLIPTASGTNITESIVRGDYAIALGVRPKALNPLRAQGLGHNVRYLDLPDADFVATNLLFSFAKTAHPGVAALFANWMLTKDVQTALTEGLHTNSARTDVPPFEPDGVPTAGQTYYEPEREANNAHAAATQRFVSGLPLVF
jgi:iron(III) transport system substrate-binding protein